MKRDEWVLVKSESELRPGMAVQLRTCDGCGNVETHFLSREGRRYTGLSAGGIPLQNARTWIASTTWCKGGNWFCFEWKISKGGLYRLADWNFDETSDDTTAPVRELVGVEERR